MKPMGIILIALGVAALGCADSGDVTDPVGASGGDAEGEVTIDGPDGESTVSGSTGKESEGGGETWLRGRRGCDWGAGLHRNLVLGGSRA